jgi:hypothetical protein
MVVLLVVAGLVLLLAFSCWSSARSYFDRGRLKGMDEAVRKIIRGISRHYELVDRKTPDGVSGAIKNVQSVFERHGYLEAKELDRYHLQLSILGDAIGEACWTKGHAEGVDNMAPPAGQVRIDLSRIELLQLSWLAHLGFLHMMPNYRGFEIHRFSGEQDAQEGTKAISKLERAIPSIERPFDLVTQYKGREQLISDWWQMVPLSRTG